MPEFATAEEQDRFEASLARTRSLTTILDMETRSICLSMSMIQADISGMVPREIRSVAHFYSILHDMEAALGTYTLDSVSPNGRAFILAVLDRCFEITKAWRGAPDA